jgi:hypothetical protein
MMQHLTRPTLLTAASAVLSLSAFAGGFWLTLGNPDASPEAKALNAVVTVLPTGCHTPADAKLTATAEGFVNGRRTTLPIKLVALPKPGFYAVTRQWPAGGKWVIRVVADYNGAITSALIPVNAAGADRRAAKYQQGIPAEQEVAALLTTLSAAN